MQSNIIHKSTNLNDMTVEALLQPRYKVIAEYPNSTRVFGQIISAMGNEEGIEYWCADKDKYPHLFRKLEWWQHRTIEDMPEYVKDEHNLHVHKIDRYEFDGTELNEIVAYIKDFGFYLTGHLPATVAEYTNYLTQTELEVKI